MPIYWTKEEMHRNTKILDELLENFFDLAIIVDSDERIIYITKSGQRHMGLKREHIIGHKFGEFEPSEEFKEVFKTGKPKYGILTNVKGKNNLTNIVPIIDDGKVIGAFGNVIFKNFNTLKKILSENDGENPSDILGNAELYNKISRYNATYTLDDYLGESDKVKRMIEDCRRVADSNLPVLIIGESGTGKEIIANALHSGNGRRARSPFIKINCTAIPENLLESELFGHEKGAFTSASAEKKGKFELAANGSILLDEIGDMNIYLQSKLLRVLEEKEFERVGGTKLLPLRARIIASTNANIPKLCAEKTFRSDLYYRLSALEIFTPSLRSRPEDIPLLVNHFIESEDLNISFTPDAMEKLKSYSWPGNVRELKNAISRYGIILRGHHITISDLNQVMQHHHEQYDMVDLEDNNTPSKVKQIHINTLEDNERSLIIEALKATHNNYSAAAKALGIGRSTLYNKINKYNILI